MMLVLATGNAHKGREISEILQEEIDIKIKMLSDYPGLVLPPESGNTYQENATIKALYVSKATGHWALGDDSGLEVSALNGAPGLFSARFAGKKATDQDNRQKLLKEMRGLPEGKRQARFICCMAIANPQGETKRITGICDGEITGSESGKSGFGYDPIFYYSPLKKTFAELNHEEKNKISHRGKAVRSALSLFTSEIINLD